MTDLIGHSQDNHTDPLDKPLEAKDLERDDNKSNAGKAPSEADKERSRKSSLAASRDLTTTVKRDPNQDYQTLLALNNNVNNILKRSGYFTQSNVTTLKAEGEDSHLRTPQRDNFYKYDINSLKYDTQLKKSGFIHTESPQKYDERKLNSILENIYKRKGLNFSSSNTDIAYSKPSDLKTSHHLLPTQSAATVYFCGDLQNDNDSFIEEITKKAEKNNDGYYCGDIQQDESVAQ